MSTAKVSIFAKASIIRYDQGEDINAVISEYTTNPDHILLIQAKIMSLRPDIQSGDVK